MQSKYTTQKFISKMTPHPLICIFEEHSFAHQIELMCINFSLFMLLHKGFRSYFKCLCLFSITLLILPSDCAGAIWDEPLAVFEILGSFFQGHNNKGIDELLSVFKTQKQDCLQDH